jgi:hypothetical protein
MVRKTLDLTHQSYSPKDEKLEGSLSALHRQVVGSQTVVELQRSVFLPMANR